MPRNQTPRRDLGTAGHRFDFQSSINNRWVEARDQPAKEPWLSDCVVRRMYLLLTFYPWYKITIHVIMVCTVPWAEAGSVPLDCLHQFHAHCNSI